MFVAYVIVTVAAAAINVVAAAVDFARSEWVLANMTRYGVPHSWILPLGVVKAAGALGLLTGIWVPFLGIAASAGLVAYFVCAVLTVLRARWYSDVRFPAAFLLLAAGSLALRLVVA